MTKRQRQQGVGGLTRSETREALTVVVWGDASFISHDQIDILLQEGLIQQGRYLEKHPFGYYFTEYGAQVLANLIDSDVRWDDPRGVWHVSHPNESGSDQSTVSSERMWFSEVEKTAHVDAMRFVRRALILAESTHYERLISDCRAAVVHVSAERYENAEEFLRRALQIARLAKSSVVATAVFQAWESVKRALQISHNERPGLTGGRTRGRVLSRRRV